MGHLCNISVPEKPKAGITTCKERKSVIQAQVKINEEFQNEYLEDLHDLILVFADAISWNGEPGRTKLGETFIDTGTNDAVKCPVQNLSPDVEKIVMAQVQQWLVMARRWYYCPCL